MMTKIRTKKQRAPREAPPPSKWGRSKKGFYFEITKGGDRGGVKRDADGFKLYRLIYLDVGVRGTQEWTLAKLLASDVRFLKRKPRVSE